MSPPAPPSTIAPPPIDRGAWPDSLLQLLERQQGMVDQLAQLAETQATFITGSQTDELLDLLAQRQLLIDQFTASQNVLGELTHGLDQRLESVSTVQRDRIRSLIGEIGNRLAQVMKRDEQDQAMLRSNRDQIKQELSSIGAGRQARSAYRGTAATNRFADRHG